MHENTYCNQKAKSRANEKKNKHADIETDIEMRERKKIAYTQMTVAAATEAPHRAQC